MYFKNQNNIFIAAAPGSASRSLIQNIEIKINQKFKNFTSGEGFGHTSVNISDRDKIYYLIRKLFFPNKKLLFYQHLFPSKYNLHLISKYIGNCYFIITYRNIYEQINYFYKILYEAKRTPLSIVNYSKNSTSDSEIDFALILLLNFYKLWFELTQKKILNNFTLISYNQIVNNDQKLLNLLEKLFNIKIPIDKKFNLKPKKNFQIKERHKIIINNFINDHKEIDFSLITN